VTENEGTKTSRLFFFSQRWKRPGRSTSVIFFEREHNFHRYPYPSTEEVRM